MQEKIDKNDDLQKSIKGILKILFLLVLVLSLFLINLFLQPSLSEYEEKIIDGYFDGSSLICSYKNSEITIQNDSMSKYLKTDVKFYVKTFNANIDLGNCTILKK